MRITKFLFSTRGRVDRSRFWLVVAVLGATSVAIGIVTLVLALEVFGVESARIDLGLITLTIVNSKARFVGHPGIASLLLLPTVVRRLHDRNRSGSRLVTFAIAYLGFGLTAQWAEPIGAEVAALSDGSPWVVVAAGSVQTVAEIATVAVVAWGFIEIACLPGTRGVNDYESDPEMVRAGRVLSDHL